MTKRPFSFSVLRYVHDPLTGEFVNVGVVAFFPKTDGCQPILKVGTRRTIGRLRTMFPDLDRHAFLAALHSIDRAARRLTKQINGDGLSLDGGKKADYFARILLGTDDSALQWAPPAGGITADVEKAFANTFHRYVSRYDEHLVTRRSDEEIWRPVRQKLLERGVPVELKEKTIQGDGDQVKFQHAWKSGLWHVYEPVSFDLANAEVITQKAHRWLGQFASIGDQPTEPFHAHLITGAPLNHSLLPAYHRALKILSKAPGSVDVYEESQLDDYVNRIEDEVRAHA